MMSSAVCNAHGLHRHTPRSGASQSAHEHRRQQSGRPRLRRQSSRLPPDGAPSAAGGAACAVAGVRRCRSRHAARQRGLGRRKRSLRGTLRASCACARRSRALRCVAALGSVHMRPWPPAACRGAALQRLRRQLLRALTRPPLRATPAAQMCGPCRLLGSQEARGPAPVALCARAPRWRRRCPALR